MCFRTVWEGSAQGEKGRAAVMPGGGGGGGFKVSGFMVPTITRNFPEKTRESAARCFALMREGKLRLHIGKTFPLAQAADAHRYLESRQSTGKLVLLP